MIMSLYQRRGSAYYSGRFRFEVGRSKKRERGKIACKEVRIINYAGKVQCWFRCKCFYARILLVVERAREKLPKVVWSSGNTASTPLL